MKKKTRKVWVVWYHLTREPKMRTSPAICTTTKAVATFLNDMKNDLISVRIARVRLDPDGIIPIEDLLQDL